MGEQLEGELGELGDLLDAEDDVLDLGLDALDRRAPAAGLLLHIYTAKSCALSSLPPAHLPQQPAGEQLSVRE